MNIEIEIPCPSCGKEFTEKIRNMKPGGSKKCPHCNKVIKYSDDDFVKIQKSLDDLERSLQRFKKTIAIKF